MEANSIQIGGRECRRITLDGAVMWEARRYQELEYVLMPTDSPIDISLEHVEGYVYSIDVLFEQRNLDATKNVFRTKYLHSGYASVAISTRGVVQNYLLASYRASYGNNSKATYNLNEKYNLILRRMQLVVNGVIYPLSEENETMLFNPALNVGGVEFRFYGMRISDSEGNAVSDLHPVCRVSDGVYGLYDSIRESFHTTEEDSTPITSVGMSTGKSY